MFVHMILNSHLDPVWLWKKEQGIDEVLSTARTACELLDTYHEIHITRGESWFYETVEIFSPEIFTRIKKHVAAGRWHIVGGWYVQPDCNSASAETYRKHGLFGQNYFKARFGVRAITGYNVDSFGHSALLPDFYAEVGIRNYCMMRPGPHELKLPSNAFLWSTPFGNSLRVFRISNTYCSTVRNLADSIDAALTASDPVIGHTMCFAGVGDHGGGPAREEIEWIMEHHDYRPGVKLIFSHPDAYFKTLEASKAELPLWKSELQHHAIGGYTANSVIKRNLHKAESLLARAEAFARKCHREDEFAPELETAWKKVLFNSFHDILAGSSIREAVEESLSELASAQMAGRDALIRMTRNLNFTLAPAPFQQLVFDNTGTEEFDGCLTVAPWLGMEYFWGLPFPLEFLRITEKDGRPVLFQQIKSEIPLNLYYIRLKMHLQPLERKILYLRLDKPEDVTPENDAGQMEMAIIKCGDFGLQSIQYKGFQYFSGIPKVEVFSDSSDAWGHGVPGDSFSVDAYACFSTTNKWRSFQSGLLFNQVGADLSDRHNVLRFRAASTDMAAVDIQLTLNWSDSNRLVKWNFRPGFKIMERLDGCPGGEIARPLNGEEYPFSNFLLLIGVERSLAIVSRDVFACDIQSDGLVRLTLLRCPYYVAAIADSDGRATDQGLHEFKITLIPMEKPDRAQISREIYRQQEPVMFSEITAGINHWPRKEF